MKKRIKRDIQKKNQVIDVKREVSLIINFVLTLVHPTSLHCRSHVQNFSFFALLSESKSTQRYKQANTNTLTKINQIAMIRLILNKMEEAFLMTVTLARVANVKDIRNEFRFLSV